jgi:hypothetical protein
MQWGEWQSESVGYRRRDRSGPGGSGDGTRDRGVPDGLVDDRRFPRRQRAFAASSSRPGSARGPRSAVPRTTASSVSRAAAAALSRAAAGPLPRAAATVLSRAAAGSLPRAAGCAVPRTTGAGRLPARRPVSPRRVARGHSIAPLRSFARTDAALTSLLSRAGSAVPAQPGRRTLENHRDEINTGVRAYPECNAPLTQWCVVTVRGMRGLGRGARARARRYRERFRFSWRIGS